MSTTASAIEWTDATWNPVAGCSMCSPGCARCYAETMGKRIKAMAAKDVADGKDPGCKRHYLDVIGDNGKWNGHLAIVPEALSDPLGWRKPRRVFVNSMSDLFHDDVPFEYVDRVFAVMALTPHHTYQILTKRPERMAEYLQRKTVDDFERKPGEHHPHSSYAAVIDMLAENPKLDFRPRGWPLPNVWLGTSVEDQKRADERIPHLLRCPAAVRFLSCEPLLGMIELNKWLQYGGASWDQSPGERRHSEISSTAGQPSSRRARNTSSGARCAIGAETVITSDTPVTGDEGSAFASDGKTSVPSSQTWENGRLPATPSSESTTTGITSRGIAGGHSDQSSRPISPTPAGSPRLAKPSHSANGSVGRESIGAPSAGESQGASPQSQHSGDSGIGWVIVGGESGHGARPCNVQWVRSIVGQCEAAAVPVFVKQLGSHVMWDGVQGGYGDGPSNVWPLGTRREDVGGAFRVWLKSSKGGDLAEFPPDLRVRQFPIPGGAP